MGRARLPVLEEGYQLDDVIGEGPYATVYRAFDPDGQTVAVKLYDSGIQRDAVFAAYFRRDVQVVQSIRHAHLLPVLHSGRARGSYYLVMPEASASTLTVYRSRRQASERIARIGAHVAHALDCLHRHDSVHGAVKPTNIFVDDEAVLLAVAGGRRTLTGITSAEAERVVVSYLSPEQIAGSAATGASDMYSLGVVLYEACMGTLPFAGADAATIAAQHLTADPEPPRSIRPGTGAELQQVILRCLQRDPAERYGSARELADALDACSAPSRPVADERASVTTRIYR